MNSQQLNTVQVKKADPMLPVGKRRWDQEQEGEIHSVSDSGVLLKSLRQCFSGRLIDPNLQLTPGPILEARERWLFHTLPKFSSKGRGNKTSLIDATPLNHTIHAQGKCDLEIGPQKFEETAFFEVHYLSSPIPYPPSAPAQNAASTSSWHSNVPYGSPYSYSTTPQPFKPTLKNVPAPPTQPETTFTPVITSLSADAVPHGLVSQVNLAASTNPILSNLLQLAAARRATEDQLQTLGLLIQSLANIESALAASNMPTAQPPLPPPPTTNYYRLSTQPPVKDFDLILEYRETPNERWLIPRGCHPIATRSDSDIKLTVCIVGKQETPSIPLHQVPLDPTSEENADRSVTFTLKNAPSNMWDTIMRWIGGEEKMNVNKNYQDSLIPPQRLYLGLQLSSTNPVLNQLQAAAAQPFSMKTLKQGPISQARRPARPKGTNPQRRTGASQQKPTDLSSEATVVKKSRISQPKTSSATLIQCITCKQGDVPLLLGGRYCRSCMDSGQWKTDPIQPAAAVQFVQSRLQPVQPIAPVIPAVPVSTNPQ